MTKYIAILLISLFTLSCNSNTSTKETISVTIEPLKYLVERIAGDDFNINVIVPESVSPETHEITSSNMRNFEKSKLFISIGLLENEFNIIESAKQSHKDITQIELKNHINMIELHSCSHCSDLDPHFWTSPKETRMALKAIYEALVTLRPEQEVLYTSNYKTLDSDIEKLDNYITDKFKDKPKGQFIIYHPAFGYFARAYNLEQIAIEKDGKDSSIQYIKEVIDKGQGVKTIFYQTQFESSTVASICNEIGATPVEINPLKYDWLNNMYAITDALYNSMN